MNTEIMKIIEAGMAGDRIKVWAYALLLSKNSKGINDSLSRRIDRLLTGASITSDIVEDENETD